MYLRSLVISVDILVTFPPFEPFPFPFLRHLFNVAIQLGSRHRNSRLVLSFGKSTSLRFFLQDSDKHSELVRYLDEELGEFMAPDWLGRDVTPNDLWQMNKTLILTYSHDASSAYNDKIWPEVRHSWGNKMRKADLKRFLGRKLGRFDLDL